MFSILLLSIFVMGQSEKVAPEAEAGQARFVRIAKIDGRAQILRCGLKEWEDAAVNMILAEGDRIYTDKGSYAELQFDNGTVARLNEQTDVEIIDLTREPDSGDEITSVYVESGAIKVKVPRYYKSGKALNVETPHGLVTVEEESSVRVNTTNKTEVIVYKGRADAVGKEGRVSLLGGERTFIEKEKGPAHPEQFKEIRGDRFDEWSIEKEESNKVSHKYLPPEIVVGVDELDCYGRWVYVHHYGWVWRPRVHFGWRPYFYGHWVYTRCWGWVWVSYEPWGWAPYHYGRWAYCWPYGWVWIPGRVWGPCWVVWCEDPCWVWWTPMGPCDGPWFYCSAHFRFGGRWVGVSKTAFKNYKYTHIPGKDYRRHKPYKYAGEPSKSLEWKKLSPDIIPAYADKRAIPSSHSDRKEIQPITPNKIPHKETVPDRRAISPKSKKSRIPSPSKEEITPMRDKERRSKPDSRILPPDEWTPHKKDITPSDRDKPVPNRKRFEDDSHKSTVPPVPGKSDYSRETNAESHRINSGNFAYKSIHATCRGKVTSPIQEEISLLPLKQTPKNRIPSVSKGNYKR